MTVFPVNLSGLCNMIKESRLRSLATVQQKVCAQTAAPYEQSRPSGAQALASQWYGELSYQRSQRQA